MKATVRIRCGARYCTFDGIFLEEAFSGYISGNSAEISKVYFREPIGSSNPLRSASKSLKLQEKFYKAKLCRDFRRLAAEVARVGHRESELCAHCTLNIGQFSERDFASGFLSQPSSMLRADDVCIRYSVLRHHCRQHIQTWNAYFDEPRPPKGDARLHRAHRDGQRRAAAGDQKAWQFVERAIDGR